MWAHLFNRQAAQYSYRVRPPTEYTGLSVLTPSTEPQLVLLRWSMCGSWLWLVRGGSAGFTGLALGSSSHTTHGRLVCTSHSTNFARAAKPFSLLWSRRSHILELELFTHPAKTSSRVESSEEHHHQPGYSIPTPCLPDFLRPESSKYCHDATALRADAQISKSLDCHAPTPPYHPSRPAQQLPARQRIARRVHGHERRDQASRPAGGIRHATNHH